MKFSYNWLQDHIVEKLPPVEEVEDVLSRKSLEVEEIVGDVLEVKVLPHRQHDCLSHRGLARELATLLSFTNKISEVSAVILDANVATPKVSIEDSKRCLRYTALRVDGVVITESPLWLKEKLESIGQRSISNVVDITNFVMNDIGQPMHAFDANKVVGKISIRVARAGEKMTTLDDRELTLNGTETVIADEEGVLALAGVKGGKKAIVDEHTTSIIFESANFDATMTRKTSDLHNIRTDSSKRYEAVMTSEFAEEGILRSGSLISQLVTGCRVGALVDVYPREEKQYKAGVSLFEINSLLGSSYQNQDVERVFNAMNFAFEKVTPEEKIKSLVEKVVGLPYKRGASVLHDGGSTFDCSGLVAWLYKEAGVAVPRISVDQYVFTYRIKKEDLRFGDLVFANSGEGEIYTESVDYLPKTKVSQGVDHVGMYIGEGNVLHAIKAKGSVVIESFDDFSVSKNVTGYGRVMQQLTEERFVITVPYERLDIRIKEDLIEEVGRVMGYDDIAGVLPELARTGLPHKRLYYENKIKSILFKAGFSEIYTYTFGDKGEVEIVKGLALDKEKIRTNLGTGVLDAIEMNLRNAPLLGMNTIKVFEFGNVFMKDKEWRSFSLGIDDGKKKSNFIAEVDELLAKITDGLKGGKVPFTVVSQKPYIIEVDFDAYIANLPEPTIYEKLLDGQVNVVYKPVSAYPFMLRDIAMWAPEGTTQEEILAVIREEGGELLARANLFDVFTKEVDGISKTSYAFNLVFLSYDRTLSDIEINEIMARITEKLSAQGLEVR